ncbi:type II secretion system F family protein [Williamsia deligens]|uniref:Type II secretion system F family protein n=1 Tax=Williamsia deligens TaxID=321325 RepID=A0ABW3G6G1_9NOCA|nr:type II secretion system protein F [Williamsia deligens]MCP2193269.1 tight adherence protein B [Williamsia deligens]
MSGAVVFLAVAAVVCLWPVAVPTRRLSAVTPAPVDGLAGFRRFLPADSWVVGGAVVVLGSLLVVGVSAGIAAGVATSAVVRRRRSRRADRARDRELDAVLDAVTVIVAELSVGAHPALACRQAAEDVNRRTPDDRVDSVADVVTGMAGRAELGGDVAAGLDAVDGAASQTWSRIAVAWRTADHHGLPMADLLQSVREDLVARRRFAERTRAALAGARATAIVLAGLPVLGIGLGQAMGAGPVAILLGGGLGGILLVVGVVLVVTGLWWTERITAKVLSP